MVAMGLTDRSLAKTACYATLYGSGDAALGATIGKGKSAGAALKRNWFKGIPALGRLIEDIKAASKKRKGWLKAVDGGWLHNPTEHASLNTVLQATGAIACKLAPVLMVENLEAKGWVWGEDFIIVAHVHDEWQTLVRPEKVEEYSKIAIDSINEAGRQLQLRLPLDGEAKSGRNWAETH
jgi:DNA polymerase I-like protein with 3'-5' exonuclease and polymerase domains